MADNNTSLKMIGAGVAQTITTLEEVKQNQEDLATFQARTNGYLEAGVNQMLQR